jgi:hypothetical protein
MRAWHAAVTGWARDFAGGSIVPPPPILSYRGDCAWPLNEVAASVIPAIVENVSSYRGSTRHN